MTDSDAELTPQEAAKLLNFSRPYIVRLMNEGVVPWHWIGKDDRRAKYQDVLTYKQDHKRNRLAALDRLSALDKNSAVPEARRPFSWH
jgi:excisionase family DNA binding protein